MQFDQEHDTVIDNADIFHIAAFVDAGAIPMFFEGADALGLAPDLVVQDWGGIKARWDRSRVFGLNSSKQYALVLSN